MLNTKLKLLAVDLDNTLTNHDDFISRANLLAIEKLQQQGVKVIIVTGRSLHGALPVYEKLKMRRFGLPIVCLNGGIIYDPINEKMLFEYLLSKEIIEQILALPKFGKIYIDQKMNHLYTNWNGFVDQFVNSYDQEVKLVTPSQLFNIKIISGFLLGDNLAEIDAKTAHLSGPEVRFASSFDNATQFSNTSKYEAVQTLAKQWSICNCQIMAIGDNLNDLELVTKVRYGIAVANGQEKLRKAAYDVTATWDQDGVAKAIAKYFYNL